MVGGFRTLTAREETGVLREPLYSKRIRRRTVVRVPHPSDARCIGLPIMRVRTQPLARGPSQLEKGSLCQESPLRAARLGLQRWLRFIGSRLLSAVHSVGGSTKCRHIL